MSADPQRHARLKRIFEAACDLAEEDRRAYLTDTCREDSTLLREVVELLEIDQSTSDPPLELFPDTADHARVREVNKGEGAVELLVAGCENTGDEKTAKNGARPLIRYVRYQQIDTASYADSQIAGKNLPENDSLCTGFQIGEGSDAHHLIDF